MKPQVQQSTIDLIASFESFRPLPYRDQGGKPTIGYGFIELNGSPVTMTTQAITIGEAKLELRKQVQGYADAISACVTYPINQNQFDALTSLCYNEGISAITNSTLIRDLNIGLVSTAADQFMAWKYVGKTVSQGLINRRTVERALFLS